MEVNIKIKTDQDLSSVHKTQMKDYIENVIVDEIQCGISKGSIDISGVKGNWSLNFK